MRADSAGFLLHTEFNDARTGNCNSDNINARV